MEWFNLSLAGGNRNHIDQPFHRCFNKLKHLIVVQQYVTGTLAFTGPRNHLGILHDFSAV